MQPPKRFQADTLADAYAKVREELGGSAVILSTRKVTAPGVFGRPGRTFVEVVAHRPAVDDAPRQDVRPSLDQDMAAHELVRGVAEATAAGLSIDPAAELAPPFLNEMAGREASRDADISPLGATRGAARTAGLEAERDPVAPAAAPAALVDAGMMGDLSRQLTEMRAALDRILSEREEARIDRGPESLRECRDLLIRQGVPVAIVTSIVDQVGAALVRGADREAALHTLERKLAAKLPPVPRLPLARRPVAIFLVGPSGAGKTTLAVRLGLDLQRDHSVHVTVAGTDVNRAGGPQQLTAFGAATGLDVQLCYAPGDLRSLLNDGQSDVVIVDTPGHNGRRRDRMAELNAFIEAAPRRAVLLVLPATMKGADLSPIASAYGALGLDGLVLTRCDETSTYGALLGAAIESSAGVAYTTHSDQVSDAPRAGDNLALAAAVLHGRWAEALAPSTVSDARQLARVG